MLKLQDEDTEEVVDTSVHCKLFDPNTCQCSAYDERLKYVPDCVILTPETVDTLPWLPETCAYKLVHEGKPLPPWHHLECGDKTRVISTGMSVQHPVVNENDIDEDDLEDYVIE